MKNMSPCTTGPTFCGEYNKIFPKFSRSCIVLIYTNIDETAVNQFCYSSYVIYTLFSYVQPFFTYLVKNGTSFQIKNISESNFNIENFKLFIGLILKLLDLSYYYEVFKCSECYL